MPDTLIRLNNVSFSYEPGRKVLDSLDFELNAGERIGLVGPNGSGKTTLLHLIVGLLHLQEGEIVAFGRPRKCEKDFLEVRRRAGLLFQDPDDQLFCATVAEDVAFGPLNLGWSHAEAMSAVRETLDSLGLNGYEGRITYRLSGGEKRLVSLATVLAMKPDVLLLDEPSSGLDEETTERIVSILTRLPQAMIVISHDYGFIGRITERMICMKNGRAVRCELGAASGGGLP